MFSLENHTTIIFDKRMEKLNSLPDTADIKEKTRKTFHLSKAAANTYEKCKLIGKNSPQYVSSKIENSLSEIKSEVDARFDELKKLAKNKPAEFTAQTGKSAADWLREAESFA